MRPLFSLIRHVGILPVALSILGGVVPAKPMNSGLEAHVMETQSRSVQLQNRATEPFDEKDPMPDQAILRYNDERANVMAKLINPKYETCNLEYPRSIIVDNKWYIDGGSLWISNGHTGIFQITEINGYLHWLDLTKSWNRGNYVINSILKPKMAPNVELGEIWYNPKEQSKFYVYGGYMPGFNTSSSLYKKPKRDPLGDIFSYDTKRDNWAVIEPNANGDEVIWSMEGGGTFAAPQGLWFYSGGYEDAWTNSRLPGNGKSDRSNQRYNIVSGFLRLDMNAVGGPKWTNETRKYENGTTESGQTQGATLTYVPYGKQGILVRLGGEKYDIGIGHESSRKTNFHKMDQIYIYDIATSTWFTQQATGPTRFGTPDVRVQHCAVMVPAPDNSSYNIFMYGGGPQNRKKGSSEIWVLSIPSFTWVRVYDSSPAQVVGASCNVYKNRQILIIGEKRVDHRSCHQIWSIYDIAENKFVEEFDPSKEGSKVPEVLFKQIGGDANGGAKINSPKDGWTTDGVKNLFAVAGNEEPPQNSTTSTGTTNPTSSSEHTPKPTSSNSTPTGAIVGGVVGGVAGLAILVFLIFFIRRKQRFEPAPNSGPVTHEMYQPPPQTWPSYSGHNTSNNSPMVETRPSGTDPMLLGSGQKQGSMYELYGHETPKPPYGVLSEEVVNPVPVYTQPEPPAPETPASWKG